MSIDFDVLLQELAEQRPIFHSERDFQYEVGWAMRSRGVKNIRMERPVPKILGKAWARVDIFADDMAVELKYPKANLKTTHHGECFSLLGVPYVNRGVYWFWQDVWRIEQLIKHDKIQRGYAILLSNRPEYWDIPRDRERGWLRDFVLEDGKTFAGILRKRPERGGERADLKDEPDIILKNRYSVKWKKWSDIKEKKYGLFCYLLLEVK